MKKNSVQTYMQAHFNMHFNDKNLLLNKNIKKLERKKVKSRS